jgi:Transposase IS4
LRKQGVFGAAIVKKRRYWPKYVKGDEIKTYFEGRQVGDADALSATLDGTHFHLMSMKEPDYVMTLMSTYGTCDRSGKETERDVLVGGIRQKVKFNYPEVVGNHFKYRHLVDDHNNRRHSPISFEENWATKTWENRVFAFLIAITEVNLCLVSHYFDGNKELSQIEFRKLLAKELIYNKYIQQEAEDGLQRSKRKSPNMDHEFLTLRVFTKFLVDKIVKANMKYAQFKCTDCTKRIRTYCRCSPGIMRCIECYAVHIREIDIMVGSPVRKLVLRTPRRNTPQS